MSIWIGIIAAWILLNVAVVVLRLRATAPPRQNNVRQFRRARV